MRRERTGYYTSSLNFHPSDSRVFFAQVERHGIFFLRPSEIMPFKSNTQVPHPPSCVSHILARLKHTGKYMTDKMNQWTDKMLLSNLSHYVFYMSHPTFLYVSLIFLTKVFLRLKSKFFNRLKNAKRLISIGNKPIRCNENNYLKSKY